MIYTVLSVIGTDIYVVEDRTVNQLRLRCCRMVITIYQRVMKLFQPTWRHHRLTIASTIASIIQCFQLSLIRMDQYGKANARLDASLLQCTLRSRALPSFQLSTTLADQ